MLINIFSDFFDCSVYNRLRNVVQDQDIFRRCNHNCLFETASKIEVFEPEQIALILYPLKDCFKIRDTGDTKQTVRIPASYTCFIAAIRCSMLEAESISFLKFSSSVARLGLLFLNGNCRFNSCDYIQWCLL